MPRLDVTRVLASPYFADASLLCTRNVQTVSTRGIASNEPTVIPFSGVVTNDTGDILRRFPEASLITGSMMVHSTLLLNDGSAGRDADLVTWQGRQYTVKAVADWSTYGKGFTMALCEPVGLDGGP